MKRDPGIDNFISWRSHVMVRSASGVLAAWGGITWMHLGWTLAISVAYNGVGRAIHANFFADWIGGPDAFLGAEYTDFLPPFIYLLVVRIAQHGDRGQQKVWLRYFVALIVATAVSLFLVNGLSADFYQGSATDQVRTVVYQATYWLMFSGLIVSVYVRLTHARRMQAALADAEVERARASRQLLASRLAAMQAQVEPKFLFNTLAQVETLYERDAASADRMLDHLIAYLRAALPQLRDDGSTLGREVQLAEAYLRIVQARMGSRLDFTFDIPPSLSESGFPPMLLLPIIDNALRHGLEPLPLGGRIDGQAAVEGNRLSVVVSDNGVGNASGLKEGSGLATIRERLHGLFGDDAQLALTAAQPHGITATIELPYEPTRDHR
jgi:sensor histidine kinase YesM